MLKLYRICRSIFANDLSGEGSKINGGRWNSKGIPVIYCSESRALATLELLVHTSYELNQRNLSLVTLYVPDNIKISEAKINRLPKDWKAYPAPRALAEIGDEWLIKNDTLALKVRSVIVKEEFNYMLNPAHKDFRKVKVVSKEKFLFDVRLRKTGKI